MSFVPESDKSERTACLYCETVWKEYEGISNDTVEQLSSTTFLSQVLACLNLKECCGAQTGMRAGAQW